MKQSSQEEKNAQSAKNNLFLLILSTVLLLISLGGVSCSKIMPKRKGTRSGFHIASQ